MFFKAKTGMYLHIRMISFNYRSFSFNFIMARKFNTAWATVFTGVTGLFTGIYVHHDSMRMKEEFAQRNFERQKELVKYKHELEQTNNLNDSDYRELLLNKIPKLNDSSMSKPLVSEDASTSVVNPLPEPRAEATYVAGAGEVNSFNVPEPSIPSMLESIPFPITASQHFAFSFFMFNVAIFICMTGLVSNYYFKLYGEEYLNKLPKWSLPIVKHYFRLREFSNYYYVVMIFTANVISMIGNIIMYILI